MFLIPQPADPGFSARLAPPPPLPSPPPPVSTSILIRTAELCLGGRSSVVVRLSRGRQPSVVPGSSPPPPYPRRLPFLARCASLSRPSAFCRSRVTYSGQWQQACFVQLVGWQTACSAGHHSSRDGVGNGFGLQARTAALSLRLRRRRRWLRGGDGGGGIESSVLFGGGGQSKT